MLLTPPARAVRVALWQHSRRLAPPPSGTALSAPALVLHAAAADILLTQRDAITNWNAYAAANGIVGWNLSYPVRCSGCA